MHYLRTKEATDFDKKEELIVKILRAIFFFLPESNPGYKNKMHLVKEWLVEFDENELPYREIGLNENGNPILAGPDETNYGFWLDSEANLKNVKGETISESEFQKHWQSYFGKENNNAL